MIKRILVVSNMYPSKKDFTYGIFVKNIVDKLNEDVEFNITVSAIKGRSNTVLKLLKYVVFFVTTMRLSLFGKYDKIYIHYISHSYIPIHMIRNFIKSEIVVHVHGGDVVQSKEVSNIFFKIKHYIASKALKNSNIVFVPSNFYSNILVEQYSVSAVKIVVYPSGGVNRALFKPDLDRQFKNKLTIGYIGRLTESKGIPLLLDAIKQLVVMGLDFKVIIVGIGYMSKEIETFIEKENFEKYVTLYPPVQQKELVKYYNQMDLFIFPTKFESLGLVGLEAMSCGVPVLGSRVGGLNDYIEELYNGYFFSSGNIEELVDKIILFKNLTVEQRDQLGDGAIKTASKYDSNVVNEILIKEFHK